MATSKEPLRSLGLMLLVVRFCSVTGVTSVAVAAADALYHSNAVAKSVVVAVMLLSFVIVVVFLFGCP